MARIVEVLAVHRVAWDDAGAGGRRLRRGRRLAAVVLLVGLIAACSNRTPASETHGPGRATLNPTSIDGLLKAITNAGLAAPNPRDVTARDCPHVGCAAKVETDTVSIMQFPTPGRAELYAGAQHDVFLVEDIVMTFSSSVPAGQRSEYERTVKGAIE